MASKGRILVVDDDANMRESILDNLEIEGYEVVAAGNAAEAVSTAQSSVFDVILTDYNLPDATGFDVIKRIRATNAESQILMFTAHASLDLAIKSIQESVYDFITKPVDFTYLKRAIGKALEQLQLERENRRLIADLQKANQQLSHLSQMKSKFMSMSSHDLANSLMTLQVSFEMLSSSIKPTEEQQKRMTYISSGIGQIARLIEDLVDWASIEQGKFRLQHGEVVPGALVEELLVGPQARAQGRGVSVGTDVAPGLPAISADKKRIAQVINNLLENAIRHTPKGGAVTMIAARRDGAVEFAVKDTGDGIAPDELEKIFQSFYQGAGKGEPGRLGLGLSISREIVASHGGKLWVESPGVGKGATFHFTIPTTISVNSQAPTPFPMAPGTSALPGPPGVTP